jgi:predicted nucleic acid-binding protein
MILALLDTNIYNRVLTQGQPGCEIEYFEQLKKLAEESKITVVVPEIVVLEFEKFYRQVSADYATRLGQLEAAVKAAFEKKEIWNELDDVKKSILALLETTGKEKPKSIADRFATVNRWLRSIAVKFVPFTIEIMWKAKGRLAAGRMPNTERTSDQDAAIIESVLTVRGSDDELYFCSTDTGDFAVPLDPGKFALHPVLRETLPRTTFFPDLKTMVETIVSGVSIPQPTEAELEGALRDAARRPNFFNLLARMRPIVERFLESIEAGEINYIRNPRLHDLFCQFSMSWERQRDQFPEVDELCRAIHHALTEMMKLCKVIKYEEVRQKRDTAREEAALEQLASKFLDLHDELLEARQG